MNADLPKLVTMLGSGEPSRQHSAAEQLLQLGDAAQHAAVALVKACQTEDETARETIVAVLEELGAPSTDAVPALAELVEHPSLDVAYWAATLLGRSGAGGAPAVSHLVEALGSHPELAVRERAAWALGQIGPEAAAARPALTQAAAGPDRRLASLAAESLKQCSA